MAERTFDDVQNELNWLLIYPPKELSTVEKLKKAIENLLAQGGSLGPTEWSGRPTAYSALHGAREETLHATAQCGFDWASSADEDAKQGPLHYLLSIRRQGAGDKEESRRALNGLINARFTEALMDLGCDADALATCARRAIPSGAAVHFAAAANEACALGALARRGADMAVCDARGRDAAQVAIVRGSPHFLGAWLSMGLPVPSGAWIREALGHGAGKSAGLEVDLAGRGMCQERLASVLLADELSSELMLPRPGERTRPL